MNNSQIDTTNYRKGLWEKEYGSRHNLPSTLTTFPSRALVRFVKEFNPAQKGLAIDMGSGNGRNSTYLAKEGYEKVIGIEFVKEAIEEAEIRAIEDGLSSRVKFINQSIGEKINLEDESADFAIDMMTLHALNQKDRANLVSEINRLVKKGGYFVFYTISAESPEARNLMNKGPGPEPNSYTFEVEGDIVSEKAFSKEELETMFNNFALIDLEPITNDTKAFGGLFRRVYYHGVMRTI